MGISKFRVTLQVSNPGSRKVVYKELECSANKAETNARKRAHEDYPSCTVITLKVEEI